QGERILPAGLDGGSEPAHARHGLARGAGPAHRPSRDLPVVPDGWMAVAVQPARPLGAPSRGPQLLPVDRLLLSYLSIVTVVALHRAPTHPACWWLVLANVLSGVLIVLLTTPGLGPIGRMLREIYPLVLLVGLYGQLDILNAGGIRVHDAAVQRWELALFGAQVSREW